jgi:hypothetical protein
VSNLGNPPGFFLFTALLGALPLSSQREFYCRVPASLAKDPSLSPRAKLLYLVLAAHADVRTGRAYLRLRRLEEHVGCSRSAREKAQSELVRAGWLRLERKIASGGRWGSRVFVVLSSRLPASAPFRRSGENEQFFISHSQVRPSTEPSAGSA